MQSASPVGRDARIVTFDTTESRGFSLFPTRAWAVLIPAGVIEGSPTEKAENFFRAYQESKTQAMLFTAIGQSPLRTFSGIANPSEDTTDAAFLDVTHIVFADYFTQHSPTHSREDHLAKKTFLQNVRFVPYPSRQTSGESSRAPHILMHRVDVENVPTLQTVIAGYKLTADCKTKKPQIVSTEYIAQQLQALPFTKMNETKESLLMQFDAFYGAREELSKVNNMGKERRAEFRAALEMLLQFYVDRDVFLKSTSSLYYDDAAFYLSGVANLMQRPDFTDEKREDIFFLLARSASLCNDERHECTIEAAEIALSKGSLAENKLLQGLANLKEKIIRDRFSGCPFTKNNSSLAAIEDEWGLVLEEDSGSISDRDHLPSMLECLQALEKGLTIEEAVSHVYKMLCKDKNNKTLSEFFSKLYNNKKIKDEQLSEMFSGSKPTHKAIVFVMAHYSLLEKI
ncbi:MAG: hypothetical protein HKM07_00195 [Chlamydiae bacterium]|nr:hypothetical protein [Chlamydiota bacterium]